MAIQSSRTCEHLPRASGNFLITYLIWYGRYANSCKLCCLGNTDEHESVHAYCCCNFSEVFLICSWLNPRYGKADCKSQLCQGWTCETTTKISTCHAGPERRSGSGVAATQSANWLLSGHLGFWTANVSPWKETLREPGKEWNGICKSCNLFQSLAVLLGSQLHFQLQEQTPWHYALPREMAAHPVLHLP